MSSATKFKFVAREVLEELPEPSSNQDIVKVVVGIGHNLHEIETPEGKKVIVQMPTKFQKRVWIKRGDYVMVEWNSHKINKVEGEIVAILMAKQIKHLKKNDLWPEEFNDVALEEAKPKMTTPKVNAGNTGDDNDEESDSDDSEEIDPNFVNPNRRFQHEVESESEDSD